MAGIASVAPSELKKFADAGGLNGIYSPYWTYDSDTWSSYTGERGDDYWETQHYTETVNGKTETQNPGGRNMLASCFRIGLNVFDDILILASDTLPRKITEKLEPWDLQNLVPFSEAVPRRFHRRGVPGAAGEGFRVGSTDHGRPASAPPSAATSAATISAFTA